MEKDAPALDRVPTQLVLQANIESGIEAPPGTGGIGPEIITVANAIAYFRRLAAGADIDRRPLIEQVPPATPNLDNSLTFTGEYSDETLALVDTRTVATQVLDIIRVIHAPHEHREQVAPNTKTLRSPKTTVVVARIVDAPTNELSAALDAQIQALGNDDVKRRNLLKLIRASLGILDSMLTELRREEPNGVTENMLGQLERKKALLQEREARLTAMV